MVTDSVSPGLSSLLDELRTRKDLFDQTPLPTLLDVGAVAAMLTCSTRHVYRLPPGSYKAHLVEKFPFNAGTGTPGIKLVFSILTEGPFKGRKLRYDIWLSDAAKPGALRDFAKLGIRDKSQIEMPLPVDKRIRCRLVVAIKKTIRANFSMM